MKRLPKDSVACLSAKPSLDLLDPYPASCTVLHFVVVTKKGTPSDNEGNTVNASHCCLQGHHAKARTCCVLAISTQCRDATRSRLRTSRENEPRQTARTTTPDYRPYLHVSSCTCSRWPPNGTFPPSPVPWCGAHQPGIATTPANRWRQQRATNNRNFAPTHHTYIIRLALQLAQQLLKLTIQNAKTRPSQPSQHNKPAAIA
jgi:hypothetical protein